MNLRKLKLDLCLAAAALLAACGSPGVPLPPSLELARPVSDLRAVRKGDRVYLTWSVPTETTEKRNIRHSGPTQVCRSNGTEMRECGTPVAAIAAPQASFTDQISQTLQLQSSGAKVIYAVNILNSYGRSAGLSNQVQVPAAPALPPPADLEAQLTADGVRLTWKPVAPPRVVSGLRYAYRMYRRELGSANDAVAGELPVADESEGSLLDHSFEWEKTYDYRASLVSFIAQGNTAEEQVEGEDTAPIRVVAHDVFPPAVPSGLQAVFSGPGQSPFIDLGWAPNTDSDLAGYNVYRHEHGAEPAKVNSEPVNVAAFRDSAVSSDHEYFYSVSAIDVRGNESARSEEASETAP